MYKLVSDGSVYTNIVGGEVKNPRNIQTFWC